MEISYCYMTSEDIPTVSKMEQLYFGQPWSEESIRHYLEDGLALFVVAKDGTRVVGYTAVTCVLDEGELVSIAVDKEYRKTGIATELLDITFDELISEGISVINLEVRESNIPAIELYKKEGFTEVGLRKGFYSNPKEDAVLFKKTLI